MLTRVLCPFLAAALLATCGPAVDQPPEKQQIADALHERIMTANRLYVSESGVKVFAACIAWNGDRPTNVSNAHWYYFPTRWSMRNRPVRQLEQSALADCSADKSRDGADCECQVIDKNGTNAIVVP